MCIIDNGNAAICSTGRNRNGLYFRKGRTIRRTKDFDLSSTTGGCIDLGTGAAAGDFEHIAKSRCDGKLYRNGRY